MRRGGTVLLLLLGGFLHEHGQHMVLDQVLGDVGFIHRACMIWMLLTYVLHPGMDGSGGIEDISEDSLLFAVLSLWGLYFFWGGSTPEKNLKQFK